MGAYHTLDLEVNRKFTVQKVWDSIDLDRVETACDPAQVRFGDINMILCNYLIVFVQHD